MRRIIVAAAPSATRDDGVHLWRIQLRGLRWVFAGGCRSTMRQSFEISEHYQAARVRSARHQAKPPQSTNPPRQLDRRGQRPLGGSGRGMSHHSRRN